MTDCARFYTSLNDYEAELLKKLSEYFNTNLSVTMGHAFDLTDDEQIADILSDWPQQDQTREHVVCAWLNPAQIKRMIDMTNKTELSISMVLRLSLYAAVKGLIDEGIYN